MMKSTISAGSKLMLSRYSTRSPVLVRSRLFSSTNDMVLTEMDEESGIAVLTLNCAPANSLSTEMMHAVGDGIKSIEANPAMQAMVVCSSVPKIFSAGLDLREVYKPDPERLKHMVHMTQEHFINLYGSRLATFAAIEGAAPGAGCVTALSCDYRVMSKKASIGLNESQLGMVVPSFVANQCIDLIGHRQAEMALTLGTMYRADEALAIGFVDEVADDDASVVEIAKQRAAEWVKIPAQARVGVKQFCRAKRIKELEAVRERENEFFCKTIMAEKSQKNIAYILKAFAKQKK